MDLVKAYDAIPCELLWKILTILGLPDKLTTMIQYYLYANVTQAINLKVGEKIEQFLSTCGVKQGDNLTPILFMFLVHAVPNSIDKKKNGISLLQTVPRHCSRQTNRDEQKEQRNTFLIRKILLC